MGEEERDEGKAEGEAEDGRELGEEEDDEVPAPVDDNCRGPDVVAQATASMRGSRSIRSVVISSGCRGLRIAEPMVEGTRTGYEV
jgi:hypothetical protein